MGSTAPVKMEGQDLVLFSASNLYGTKATVGAERACPTSDLSATVLGGNHLMIHRKEAEYVVHSHNRGIELSALKWKADGSAIAIAWGNFTIQLLGLDMKGSHHIKLLEKDGMGHICHVGWVKCAIGPQRKLTEEEWQITLHRGGLGTFGQKNVHDMVPGLPHQVSYFEADPSIPKLSPLPVSGNPGEYAVFSTQANIDFVFPAMHKQDPQTVDVLVSGTCRGLLHVHIYDSFEIGVFCLSRLRVRPVEGHKGHLLLRGHAAHPNITTHSLIVSEDSPQPNQLWHVAMDMTNLVKSSIPLTLLANKAVTLRGLVRYAEACLDHIRREWQATVDLPKRLTAGVQEDLQNAGGDIVQTIYHHAVTGSPHPILKEWLVDTLAERGHKRWDKTVSSGLEKVRDLTHQNLRPALERINITLSRLLGLASFYNGDEEIGFTASQVERLLEHNKCMSWIAQMIEEHSARELTDFRHFSAWLRAEIDRLATANPSEDLSEREARMEMWRVTDYIKRDLLSGKLFPILSMGEAPKEGGWIAEWKTFSAFPDLLYELQRHTGLTECNAAKWATPYVQAHFQYMSLRHKTRLLLAGITEAQQRTIHLGTLSPMRIGGGNDKIAKWDTRVMIPRPSTDPSSAQDPPDAISMTAMISYEQQSQNIVFLFRTSMKIENGISTVIAHDAAAAHLPSGAVADIKFISDDLLGVLWRADGEATVLCLPLNHKAFPKWQPFDEEDEVKGKILMTFVRPNDIKSAMCWMSVPLDDDFNPATMQIMPPSTASGDLPGRICMMDKNGQIYRVFELPPLEQLSRPSNVGA